MFSGSTCFDLYLCSLDEFDRRLWWVRGQADLAEVRAGSLSGATSQCPMAVYTSQNTSTRVRDGTLVIAGWRTNLHNMHYAANQSAADVFRLDCSESAEQRGRAGHPLRV